MKTSGKNFQLILRLCLFAFLAFSAARSSAAEIGFYFGTFDPIHSAHIQIAETSVKLLKLDKLFLIPNYTPAHKPRAAGFEDRFNMVSLVVKRRHGIFLPPKDLIKTCWERNPENFASEVMEEILKRENHTGEYFHICGSDSFQKMSQIKRLPTLMGNRVVIVIDRIGYSNVFSPEIETLTNAGKIRFRDFEIPELGSTKIRGMLAIGAQPDPKELPVYIYRFIQKNGLHGTSLPKLGIPATFRPSIVPKFPGNGISFKDISPGDLGILDSLDSPLLIDFDRYIQDKFPELLLQMILTRDLHVHLVGGLFPETLAYLNQAELTPVASFISRAEDRIRLAYILARKKGQLHLVITNFFGTDRLKHMAFELLHLFDKNLLPLDRLHISTIENYGRIPEKLLRMSLKSVKNSDRSVVFLGYRGSLEFVVGDFFKFFAAHGVRFPSEISLEELDRIHDEDSKKEVLRPEISGSPYFPYSRILFPTPKGEFTFYAFRNLYGDQTRCLIDELLKKGFRKFVIFGNGGGLRRVEIGKVYAPGSASDGRCRIPLNNAAAIDYPKVSVRHVNSILEENISWLNRVSGPENVDRSYPEGGGLKNLAIRAKMTPLRAVNLPRHDEWDLVEVENFRAGEALLRHDDIWFYSGVLVSDLPGIQDITRRDEDSDAFIEAKRDFFLKALRQVTAHPR